MSDISLTITVTVERLSMQVQTEATALLSSARKLLKADARGFDEAFVLEEVDDNALEEVDVKALEEVEVEALEEVDVDDLEDVNVRFCSTVVSTIVV